jgi:hypothetical protein
MPASISPLALRFGPYAMPQFRYVDVVMDEVRGIELIPVGWNRRGEEETFRSGVSAGSGDPRRTEI